MLNVLIVLWWTAVAFSTVVAASLVLLVGWTVTRPVRRRFGFHRVSFQTHPFVRRVLMPVWFTSVVVWVALESLGAVLLLWSGRFDLEPLPDQTTPAPRGEMLLVALGGSTTLGAPYDARLSFPDIVGWRLRKTFPTLRVRVQNLAYGGADVKDMYEELRTLETRPDVLIVYAGHNEFLRYPPDREAATAYYGVNHPSLLSRAIAVELERIGAHEGPLWRGKRRLFDRPVCTEHEESVIYRRFRQTLGEIMSFSQRSGILTVVFLPASNESGFAPNRSTLPGGLSMDGAARMEEIYGRIATGPGRATEFRLLKAARRLAPGFAETWYRLGKLYEASGSYGKARKCYQRAIDADRFPVRATSGIRTAIRDLAGQHGVVLVDAREVIAPLARKGILGSDVIHDNCHPNLPAHVALANATLRALRDHDAGSRGTLAGQKVEWPLSGYEATVASVIEHFGMDRNSWIRLCERQGDYYKYLAVYHHDIEARLAKSSAYLDAAARMKKGIPPWSAGIPGMDASAFQRGVGGRNEPGMAGDPRQPPE